MTQFDRNFPCTELFIKSLERFAGVVAKNKADYQSATMIAFFLERSSDEELMEIEAELNELFEGALVLDVEHMIKTMCLLHQVFGGLNKRIDVIDDLYTRYASHSPHMS